MIKILKPIGLSILKVILGVIVVITCVVVVFIPIIIAESTGNYAWYFLYLLGIGGVACWLIGHIVFQEIKDWTEKRKRRKLTVKSNITI